MNQPANLTSRQLGLHFVYVSLVGAIFHSTFIPF